MENKMEEETDKIKLKNKKECPRCGRKLPIKVNICFCGYKYPPISKLKSFIEKIKKKNEKSV